MRLFVYGELLRGQPFDGLLAGLNVREGTVVGRLYRTPAGKPLLALCDAGRPIRGELVELPDPSRLRTIDVIEGVPVGRCGRIRVTVATARGPVEAWTYAIGESEARLRGLKPLRTTDWRRIAPRRTQS